MLCETKYYSKLPDGRIQCDACPRHCKLREGQRGLCSVRGAANGKIWLLSYGQASGFCIDPIEKKPLNHFLPGTPVLSFGQTGCNLTCRFCQNYDISKAKEQAFDEVLKGAYTVYTQNEDEIDQQSQRHRTYNLSQNWDISKSRQFDRLNAEAGPEAIAAAAAKTGCRSVAFTYNDPVIFLEYAVDVAEACHARGIKTVAVSAGYIEPEPRAEFFRHMDAANIDLKGFTEDFYRVLCTASLAPVLDTLRYLKHETDVWFEITTLLIPGRNDSDAELNELCAWVASELGPDVPIHFSAFHPDWKMRDLPPTPPATLRRARDIAISHGLRYAYVGNVHDPDADSTWCHGCGERLIGRDWYELSDWNLTPDGCCTRCGTRCAGVFEAAPGTWGRRRLPLRVGLF